MKKISSLFKITPFLLALAVPLRLRADEPSFTAEVDKTSVALDDVVTLRVTLSGDGVDGAKPVIPNLPGFRATPAGQSQNISFVNGRVSSEVSYSYILQPQAAGNYTIPPLTVMIGGRPRSTAPIAVRVTAAAGGGTAAEPVAQNDGSGRAVKDLFLTASTDKGTAFVGEPVALSVRFYSRAPLLAQPAYGPPDTAGFLSEDLPPQKQSVEIRNGRRFTVIELKTALFPAAPGTAVVGPATLECRTEDFSDDSPNDPFGGGFFNNFFSGGRPVTLKSDPVQVKVLPLPSAGRPAGFKGDVGRYRLSASLDKTSAALHEPVTLTVTVQGEGNIKALTGPDLPPLPGFKAYDTLSSLNLSKAGWKVQGSKVFKTILKPEVSGRLALPPLVFSFFDPGARAYRTETSQPLALTVTGADAAAVETGTAPLSTETLKVLSQDIRYIKEGPLRRRPRSPGGFPLFPLWNLPPLAGFALLWAAKAARGRAAADPDAASFRRAGRRAARSLGTVRALLDKGDAASATEVLEKTLRDYLSDKSGLSPQGLSGEDAARLLEMRGAAPEVSGETLRLWDELQTARYAPGGLRAQETARHLESLRKLLPSLEALWKK